MSDPFVAEIRMFAGNFAPTGWATCDGQLMPLSQNTALFSLLGTVYGGDGKSTFALPNLQGSHPMHPGQGQGLSERFLGEQSGSDYVTLLQSEMPAHTHGFFGTGNAGETKVPDGSVALALSVASSAYQTNTSTNLTNLSPAALTKAGADLPHNNLMPYLVVTFIIALQGVYPPRS